MPWRAHTVRFGPFQLDLRAAELRQKGNHTKLPEQPFQVLTALLEHPGEVVTREELRQRLWGSETFVDFEHGLNAAVKRLRETLGDSAENPRYIETLPRHGYRLIVPVERAEPVAADPAGTVRRWRVWLAVVVVTALVVAAPLLWRQRRLERAVRIESLAVLPLDNLWVIPTRNTSLTG
jgi:DNA-binding winged helix-turn-helix (wHTH) protein